jgi:hypothetical protein
VTATAARSAEARSRRHSSLILQAEAAWELQALTPRVRVPTRGGNACPYEPPSAFPGPVIRLGTRQHANLTCRDEVLPAIVDLRRREGLETFTPPQVAAEMLAAGTAYKRSAIVKTIQRMRGEDGCTATRILRGSTARTFACALIPHAECAQPLKAQLGVHHGRYEPRPGTAPGAICSTASPVMPPLSSPTPTARRAGRLGVRTHHGMFG